MAGGVPNYDIKAGVKLSAQIEGVIVQAAKVILVSFYTK